MSGSRGYVVVRISHNTKLVPNQLCKASDHRIVPNRFRKFHKAKKIKGAYTSAVCKPRHEQKVTPIMAVVPADCTKAMMLIASIKIVQISKP